MLAKTREIDFVNINSCQNVLSDVVEASNEDISSQWQSVRFSRIGKRSMESYEITPDIYQCSVTYKL